MIEIALIVGIPLLYGIIIGCLHDKYDWWIKGFFDAVVQA